MKAKEIAAEILKITSYGCPPNEAVAKLLSQDFEDMRKVNKDRKGGSAALLRLIREYNQKWNAVINQLNQHETFQDSGRTWLRLNDFARAMLALAGDEDDEAQLNMILSPVTSSNAAVARVQRSVERQESEAATFRQFFFN